MGASSSTCSSSITTHGGKYDLFVSFRGEDIRDKFRSHFCDALSRKKIDFFVDEKLERGDEIWPALSEAIEGSRISVVMFSKNYASSKWCLRELVKILECKETSGQIVIPVFYEVDPSDVRNQRGSFEDAFIYHEKISEDEKQKWKAALTYASNLSGFDSSKIRPESKLVDEIINNISKKLKDGSPLNELSGLVGICSRVEQVISLLCIGKSDFEIVGIWGMGGIGKTTVAEAVLNQVSGQFEGNYFFANVREESKNCNGLVRLRENVLSKILEEDYVEFSTPNVSQFVKEKLKRKKVLIVLDDVNNSKQLETLAKGLDEFGPGSRIIITTRDKQLLYNFGVTKIYEVKAFDNQEAHKLFCRYAFKQNVPPHKDFVMFVAKVIDYAKGNPLALKVVGSSLHQKTTREWKSAVNKLNKIYNPDIHNLLRISYDGLNNEEKEIFLDIAFSFKGHDKQSVIQILDGCCFAAEYGLSVLIDKALVNISTDDIIDMHDLLQELGYEIVRKESRNPGERSRLHDHEDVCLVLRRNMGTYAVKSISLNMSKTKDIYIHHQVFKKMWNVRFLNFYNPSGYISKVHGPNYLPDELRYLRWDGYPSKALPSNLSMDNLVQLSLRGSSLQQLWEGEMDAPNLKWLDLSKSQHLTRIPEFSNAPCLEAIGLAECEMLKHVSLNIFKLKSLRDLYLDGCSNLEIFPEIPDIVESLETLSLSYTAIKELPVSIENLNGLSGLGLRNCKNLEMLPSSICNLRSLSYLDIFCCSKLNKLPENLGNLKSLTNLSLEYCNMIEIPEDIGCLSSLTNLELSGNDFESLPKSIKQLSNLRWLDLNDCKMLQSLPELPLGLHTLRAMNCKQLKSLPEASYFAKGLIASNQSCSFLYCVMLNQKIIGNALRESLLLIQRQKGYEEEIDFEICFPGCDIPDWFDFKNFGSYLNIKLPLHNWGNPKLLGFGLCATVMFDEDNYVIFGEDIYEPAFFSCECRFATKYSEQNYSTNLPVKDGRLIYLREKISKMDHVVFRYFNCPRYDKLFSDDFITCSFEFKASFGVSKIINCGVHPIFEEPIISLDKFGATNQDFVETSGSGKRVCDDHEAEIKPNLKRICKE